MAKGPARIVIDGDFQDWKTVEPEFRDTIGDTAHRNHKGYGDLFYTNDTGRNDFVMTKVAFDKKDIYFFVQTQNAITPYTDTNWMLLFIDTDQNARTGWSGYDFALNLQVRSRNTTSVQIWRSNKWAPVGKANYRVNGNGMEISISRSLIGQQKQAPAFDFHWADNIQNLNDPSEFGVNGDSAPNRRWNYRFKVAPD